MNRNLSSNRARTLASLGICGLAVIGAAIVGIDDNPPGLVLAYVAALFFIIAFVHSWRSKRQFGMLAIASLLGFVVFAFIHNVFEVIASNMTAGLLKTGLEGVQVAGFILAVLISPAAFFVGLIGVLVVYIYKLFQKRQT